jgi:hypothetical protein
VWNFEFTLDEFLEDTEAVKARHLDVKEDEFGRILFDEVDGFETVFTLAKKIDFREGLEKEDEFFASGLFVVDDDGVDGHKERKVLSYTLSVISVKSKAKSEGAEGLANGRGKITTEGKACRTGGTQAPDQTAGGERKVFGYDAGFGRGGR